MSDTNDTRRRRAAWRAAHRGTKELDLLIGRYAEAHLGQMDDPSLSHFEAFLSVEEPDLQQWLLAPEMADAGEFAGLVSELRRFHGLAG